MKRKIWTFIRAIFAVSGKKSGILRMISYVRSEMCFNSRDRDLADCVYYRSSIGGVSAKCRSSIGQVAAKCRPSVGQVSAKCRASIGEVLAKCRRGIGDLKSYVGRQTCRSTVDRYSIETRSTLDRQSTECRSSIDRLSTDIAVDITYSKHDPARHVGIISSQVATKVDRSYNSVFLYP